MQSPGKAEACSSGSNPMANCALFDVKIKMVAQSVQQLQCTRHTVAQNYLFPLSSLTFMRLTWQANFRHECKLIEAFDAVKSGQKTSPIEPFPRLGPRFPCPSFPPKPL
jgi:hypothetical protein